MLGAPFAPAAVARRAPPAFPARHTVVTDDLGPIDRRYVELVAWLLAQNVKSVLSYFSYRSVASALSTLSFGSLLALGSAFSLGAGASIASVGSFASVGSALSTFSLFSVGCHFGVMQNCLA